MSEFRTNYVYSFFAPIAGLLADDTVSEVLINGPREVFAERGGRLRREDVVFEDPGLLERGLRAAAQFLALPFDERNPILEGTLPDGSRIEALMAPLVPDVAAVAIRKHARATVTLDNLVDWGALTQPAVRFLSDALIERRNVLVSGGTGSGKTSLLNCLASLVPKDERTVTIEDARELALHNPHVLSLLARPADANGGGRVGIRELFRATLRLRPDRIVIGELRGPEALDLLQAMNSGHGGCLSTIHASTAFDALHRLETLALEAGVALPLAALRAQIASAVHVIVQTERRGGFRGVTCISQVEKLQGGEYRVTDRFRRSSPGAPLAVLSCTEGAA